MADMSRRHPRIRTRLTATVHLEGDRTIVCPTRDVSAAGCFLETADEIATGTRLTIAVMDLTRGEVIEVNGAVARREPPDDSGAGGGIGILLGDVPDDWHALVEREQQMSGPVSTGPTVRLRVLVVGEGDRRRGALALYVTSGWDIRFASDLDGAVEALEAVKLNAVIAEHDLDDRRWTDILSAAKQIQPDARRIVRAKLGGTPAPQSREGDLVHRVVDMDAGMDALLDALTADLGY
jgi:hypothetical protein